MELSKLLIYIAIGIFVMLLIFFPEFRKLCMGWTRLFVKDMASTPEGARAIYEEKINEVDGKYRAACDALKLASGRLKVQNDNLRDLENRKAEAERMCEELVKAGKFEDAEVISEDRADIISDIERTKTLIEACKKAEAEAMEAHKMCENNLRKLKREAKEVVENMKVKEQLNEVYDSMDELKANTATDKLLNSIKEKNDDLNAMVEGSRVLHNNKTSTKVQKANEQAKKLAGDDYLNSLKKKYNK